MLNDTINNILQDEIYQMEPIDIDETIDYKNNDATLYASFISQLFIHWDDGANQFGSIVKDNVTLLYSITNNGSNISKIATFPPLSVKQGRTETEWCNPSQIFSFELIDDWIILTAGEIQGSMRNFFGDMYRINLVSGERESFNLFSDNNHFIIIDGWIYHFIWRAQNLSDDEGWIRIRPDGTDRESLKDFIYTIIKFGTDGYIYGTNTISGNGNLSRWKPEYNEPITLFRQSDLPVFEVSNVIVFYRNIIIDEEHIYFTVIVQGERNDVYIEPWFSLLEDIYTAHYRINKNGSNLILLYETHHFPEY